MTGHKTPKTKALTAEDPEDAEENPEPKTQQLTARLVSVDRYANFVMR